ncbi:hypothetical protein [Helicobacter typhlonius]|uniref:hypothetical protein n=1 Tax=Helicobacter typhlonius TaxID=76936 RepID=UPI002FDF9CD5
MKWKITLEMLRQVFEYDKAKGNAKTKMDTMLPQMVEELNSIKDNKPMYMHYNLDTRARLEHFFAQCYVEVGGNGFRLEEGLEYSVKGLVHTFSYYHTSKEKIKEALNDGKATQEKHYKVSDILSSNNSSANEAIQDFVQDYINNCTNTLPKNNGVINQTINITQIETTLEAESKKKFDENKDYSPIELIESFKEYQSYTTIQLAFRHAKVALAKDEQYEIPYSTDSNKAFVIIAQALFNNIINKRSDKNANEVVIGNKIYADKNRSDKSKLGNIQQGDGYKFRGRGIKQLTGRDHYTKFSKYAKNKNWVDTFDYFVNNPDSITTNGKFALLSAVYFWNSKELYKIADKQSENNTNEIVKQITKKVNGGESALSDR